MKHSLGILMMSLILFSCKKEISHDSNNTSLLAKIKNQLKDSVTADDYQHLNFDNSVIMKFPKEDISVLRIPFFKKEFKSDFLLLKVEQNNSFSIGRIINLVKDQNDKPSEDRMKFNGKILIYSLTRQVLTNSPITNGYINSFHSQRVINGRPLSLPIIYETMPDVAVVASYPPKDDEWAYSDWYNMQSLLNQGDHYGGNASGSQNGSESYTGGYYNNGSSGEYPHGGASPYKEDPVLIDFEPVENLQPIDVAKYLKCFNNIPDAGSTCTIKIFTDIPVDSDPTVYLDTETGSPGHTFLQIRKTNGSQTVQQYIGFYPKEGWKTIASTLPVDGKFVDNADHEFNASLIMTLTPEKFQKTLNHIQVLADVIKYDIAMSNCTDFALDVFNFQRGANTLSIAPFNLPGRGAPHGMKTPQALYLKLKEMSQKATDPESRNVTIPGVKGFAANSNGPCN